MTRGKQFQNVNANAHSTPVAKRAPRLRSSLTPVKGKPAKTAKDVPSFNKGNTSSKTLPNKVGKKRRFKPGTRALMEIRRIQKTTNLLISKAPFSRLIKEILMELGAPYIRVQSVALEALQEAAESFIIHLMELSNLASIHAKRKTLYQSDLRLVRRIKGTGDANWMI